VVLPFIKTAFLLNRFASATTDSTPYTYLVALPLISQDYSSNNNNNNLEPSQDIYEQLFHENKWLTTKT